MVARKYSVLAAFLAATFASGAHAQTLTPFSGASLRMPGTQMTCPGDSYFVFAPPASGAASNSGEIPWPTVDFSIVWVYEQVISDDPNITFYVGIQGANGDPITAIGGPGSGFIDRSEPANVGRTFHVATDAIHFHYHCSAGSYANINGAIEFVVP